jgi:hypothetical protein
MRLLTAVFLFASFHAVAEVTLTPLNNNTPADADDVMGNFNALNEALPPSDCTTNQIIKWDGSAWVCAADPLTNLSGCSVGDVLSYDGSTVACGFVVSPSAGEGGSISPDTAVFVAARDTTTFTVSPDNDWEVASIDGTCGGSLSGNTYTTNSITAACTVEASFQRVYYVVDVYIFGGGGTSDPSGPTAVPPNSELEIRLMFDETCFVSSVDGTCGGQLFNFGRNFLTDPVTEDCYVQVVFHCD